MRASWFGGRSFSLCANIFASRESCQVEARHRTVIASDIQAIDITNQRIADASSLQ
jgi:hypothetical protein